MLTGVEFYRGIEPVHDGGGSVLPVEVLDVNGEYRVSSGMQWELAWDEGDAGQDARYVPGDWLSQSVAGQEPAGLVRVRVGEPLVVDASAGGSLEALALSAGLAERLVRAHPDIDNTPDMPVPSPLGTVVDEYWSQPRNPLFPLPATLGHDDWVQRLAASREWTFDEMRGLWAGHDGEFLREVRRQTGYDTVVEWDAERSRVASWDADDVQVLDPLEPRTLRVFSPDFDLQTIHGMTPCHLALSRFDRRTLVLVEPERFLQWPVLRSTREFTDEELSVDAARRNDTSWPVAGMSDGLRMASNVALASMGFVFRGEGPSEVCQLGGTGFVMDAVDGFDRALMGVNPDPWDVSAAKRDVNRLVERDRSVLAALATRRTTVSRHEEFVYALGYDDAGGLQVTRTGARLNTPVYELSDGVRIGVDPDAPGVRAAPPVTYRDVPVSVVDAVERGDGQAAGLVSSWLQSKAHLDGMLPDDAGELVVADDVEQRVADARPWDHPAASMDRPSPVVSGAGLGGVDTSPWEHPVPESAAVAPVGGVSGPV